MSNWKVIKWKRKMHLLMNYSTMLLGVRDWNWDLAVLILILIVNGIIIVNVFKDDYDE